MENNQKEIEIKTVGELRKLLSYSDDKEPIIFDLKTIDGTTKYIKCVGAGSSGGGRITILWMNE